MSKQGEIPQDAVIKAFESWGIPDPAEIRGVHVGVRWMVVERWASNDEHYEIIGGAFERMLADPNEQFDKRSEILASIDAYSKAVSATASAAPKPPGHAELVAPEHQDHP